MWRVALALCLVSAIASAAPRAGRTNGRGRSSGSATAFTLDLSTDNCSGAPVLASDGSSLPFTRASNAYCTKNDGTLVLLNANVPRVNATGYLSEAASTNICLQSQTLNVSPWAVFGSGGAATAPVVTANAAVAPDGTSTAEQIAFGNTSVASSFSVLVQSIVLASADYTASIWLKAASNVTVYLTIARNTTYFVNMCNVTTTWTRCSVSATGSVNTWSLELGGDRRSGSGQLAIASPTVFAWGAQVELKPYATSNITTVAASVTRSADFLSCTTPSTFPTSSGSAALVVTPLWSLNFSSGPGTAGALIGELSANQGMQLSALTDTTLQLSLGNGSSSSNTTSSALSWTAGTSYSLSTSWGGGAQYIARDGATLVLGSSATVPTGTVTPVGLGAKTDGTAQCDCYLRNIIISK